MEANKKFEFSKQYDQTYYAFQRKMGELVGWGNPRFFARLGQPVFNLFGLFYVNRSLVKVAQSLVVARKR